MFDSELNSILHLGAFHAKPHDSAFDDLLFSRTFPHFFLFGSGTVREVFQRGENALQIEIHIFIGVLAQLLEREAKDEIVCSRVERKNPIIIGEIESSVSEPQTKLAAFEYPTVLIAENRKKHLFLKLCL